MGSIAVNLDHVEYVCTMINEFSIQIPGLEGSKAHALSGATISMARKNQDWLVLFLIISRERKVI